MADEFRCAPGDWVEIEYVLLAPAERAPGLPDDTAAEPLRAWVKGFARTPGMIGDQVEIETMTGRMVGGHLSAISPGYYHTFGAPPKEIVGIGRDLRARVAAYRKQQPERPSGIAELAEATDAEIVAAEAGANDLPPTPGPEAGE